jgi:hypothetical protein
LAHATFLGQALDVGQRGGFARVHRRCSHSTCPATILASLRILAEDFTVSGVTVRNAEIRSNRPAAIKHGVIEAGDLILNVVGTVGSNDVSSKLLLTNTSTVSVTATHGMFNLQGGLTLTTRAPDGFPMDVSVSLSSSGAAAPALRCDVMTAMQRRFGFEDASTWSSAQAALSTVVTPRTEGCFAMGVEGSGYMTIESPLFPSDDAGHVSKLLVDLFVPTGQPNPYWLGSLQSFLECPSANLFNAYVGQVELTGRPIGQFSTLSFSLPPNVAGTLAGNWNDCKIRLGLNVNQTGQVWVLDKLRFTR